MGGAALPAGNEGGTNSTTDLHSYAHEASPFDTREGWIAFRHHQIYSVSVRPTGRTLTE
jgi:hypothetical protein